MAKYSFAVSVGHNSSAVLIRDGEILGGYETERITKVKSDSAFPIQPILELKNRFSVPSDAEFNVSHWFPNGKLDEVSKYWNAPQIIDLFPNAKINTLDALFTHHDAHMESARVFAGNDFADDYHTFVVDGFGNLGECISIYWCYNGRADLIERIYGYNNSLGLFYQYATAFCEMKMHAHEYKMLAFETHITKLFDNIDEIDEYIDQYSKSAFDLLRYNSKPTNTLDDLKSTRSFVDLSLSLFLKKFTGENISIDAKRIMVSYFSQRHLENMMLAIVRWIKPRNLLVSGGVFLNVKLNHVLANSIPGRFCANPLAGDQGAGLGVYQHFNTDLKWPEHLFWGHRTLDEKQLIPHKSILRVKPEFMYEAISRQIRKVGFVNVVRGSMEYGPRALCNTSTIARPDKLIGQAINAMNDRTNEMPFAMVMTEDQANMLFDNTYKVHKSLEYMIMARKFKELKHIRLEGGAHFYPQTSTYTCRPQITKDPLMTVLCHEFGPLINTSWNYHGEPIVWNTDDIVRTHENERKNIDVNFITIVEKENK